MKQFDDYEDPKDQELTLHKLNSLWTAEVPWSIASSSDRESWPQRCLFVRGTATEVSQLRAVWSFVSVILFECSMTASGFDLCPIHT